ncbi:hypothetical protein [Polluticoccus soli]|uniref:hypothetical protein n=1 Tax=Polluticoccus soli TaxID=3034150 RepID=UPI0023E2403F|nr:hypothetical protein [Flavipsychrobacter sp. JY13-12]
MKNLRLIILLVFAASCKKSSTGNNPTSTLNATEQKLVGTWYLKKERLIQTPMDTTYTIFSGKPYVKFTDAPYLDSAYKNRKRYTDNAGMAIPSIGNMRGSTTFEEFGWEYDENSDQLIVYAFNYTIAAIDQKNLILCPTIHNTGASKDTLWFEK